METSAATSADQLAWLPQPLITPRPDPVQEAYAKRRMGPVPRSMAFLYPQPWLARTVTSLTVYKPMFISPRLMNLGMLVVVQDHACRYCFGAVRTMMKILGFEERLMNDLGQDLQRAELEPVERVALEFVKKVSRSNPRLAPAEFAALEKAGLSRPAALELAFLTAFFCFQPRVHTAVADPPDDIEKIDRLPILRFARPALAWLLKKMMKKEPHRAFPAENSGPGAELVEALREVPSAAALLRELLDECFQNGILPMRTKALIFAVIARSIGCAYCENHGRALLEREGWTSGEIDRLLAHLVSPKLDELDARIVALARETVRYQTPVYQRKFHEFIEYLRSTGRPDADAIFLDVAGTAAFANSLTRLTIILRS
jgi:alkylhydroperoxidase family enzyme